MTSEEFNFIWTTLCSVSEMIYHYTEHSRDLGRAVNKWNEYTDIGIDVINGEAELPDDYLDKLREIPVYFQKWIDYDRTQGDELQIAMQALQVALDAVG